MKRLVFSYIGVSIVFIFLQVILEFFINEDLKKFLTQLIILLSISFLLNPYLKAFRRNSDESELKLLKEQKTQQNKLFTRLGDEFDTDLFIYEIVGELDDGINDLADIKLFKAKITEKIGSNLNEYYLIREAIEIKLKSGFVNFLSEISKKILISALTIIISGLFITKAITIISTDNNNLSLLTLLIQFINFGLLALICIYMFFYSFKGVKNRASLLKSIIELIIKVKENEGVKNRSIII